MDITKDFCSVVIGTIGRRAYTNSPSGREELRQDCEAQNASEILSRVLEVWGNASTIADEPLPPEPTLDELKAQKKDAIAAARYGTETAGTTVNGITIDTGRDSQALITGAAVAAMLDDDYSLNWKTAAGFIHLTSSEIIAVAQAVRVHVQTCFDREGELVALVDAAQTAEELDAIDISFE